MSLIQETLTKIKICAKKAGIHNNMFLGFGTLLGAIREKQVIEYDWDMDLCFIGVSPQKKQYFLEKCTQLGLMKGWEKPDTRIAYKPNGEVLWFSTKLQKKSIKCCCWFFIEWADIYWHTKGKEWVSDLHFDPKKRRYKKDDEALMKGIQCHLFDKFTTINFYDMPFLIPEKSGTILDYWYPDWYHPRQAVDSYDGYLCRVEKWHDTTTWGFI